MTAQNLDMQITHLSQHEKIHMFQRLALDLTHGWPGIEKTPGVQGGDACIVRTRIPVWTLESYRQLGWDNEQILISFPTLRPSDLFYAWMYVEGNRAEIEQARRIDAAIRSADTLAGALLRVNRPS